MITIDHDLTPSDLRPQLDRMWQLSGQKIDLIEARRPEMEGAPVYTVEGRYTSRGWTEWTEGFMFGAPLLQFDATGDTRFLDLGRARTLDSMLPHVTHFGVHDHGFNNVSTYGNLRRLLAEGRFEAEGAYEAHFYESALAASASVQARRWTDLGDGRGYVTSFNGPHSLFADTVRTMRVMAIGHLLGHAARGENDARIGLLDRLLQHVRTTADYIVYFGEGRDSYDESGRTAHEALFNLNDRRYRCASTQQGYSPFTTWTRGQAWVLTGSAELLEFIAACDPADFPDHTSKEEALAVLKRCAVATAEHYIANTPTDGVCYWDTGAPGLAAMPDHKDRASDPFNDHEPVDSSATAINVQGLLILARYLADNGEADAAARYRQTGLTMLRALLAEPYLSTDETHEGLLLHSIYHRPNGWDHVPAGAKVPHGESCMWGDYHLREAALVVQRELDGRAPYRFFSGFGGH